MTVYNKTISKVMDNNKTGYTQLAAVVIFVACANTKHTGVEKKKKKRDSKQYFKTAYT